MTGVYVWYGSAAAVVVVLVAVLLRLAARAFERRTDLGHAAGTRLEAPAAPASSFASRRRGSASTTTADHRRSGGVDVPPGLALVPLGERAVVPLGRLDVVSLPSTGWEVRHEPTGGVDGAAEVTVSHPRVGVLRHWSVPGGEPAVRAAALDQVLEDARALVGELGDG